MFDMNTKGYVTSGILLCGFIGFIVGVPSYEMIYLSPSTASTTSAQPTYSYSGACDDSTQYQAHCASLTSDFWHCMNGDQNFNTYNYNKLFWAQDPNTGAPNNNGLDTTLCSRMMTCEAFGLMAIILSFMALLGALFHEKGRIGGGIAGIIASFFGAIALAIFFSSKPEFLNNFGGVQQAHNSDLSDFLSDGIVKLGYSTGLQIAGIIAAFVGGSMALVLGDFAQPAVAAAPGHKSTGSIGHSAEPTQIAMPEMH